MGNAAMADIAGWMSGQMMGNIVSNIATEIKFLNSNADREIYENDRGGGGSQGLAAIMLWTSMVKAHAPWDHKKYIRQNFGEWCLDEIMMVKYRYDMWSNIHYGYVGLAVGFDLGVLKSGAGLAQAWDNKPTLSDVASFLTLSELKAFWGSVSLASAKQRWKAASFSLPSFDDPKDQAAIDVGGRLWSDFGAAMSVNDLIDACRARADELSSRHVV